VKSSRFNANYIDALFFLVIGIIIRVLIPYQVTMTDGMEDGIVSPSLFPKIVAWLLIILSLFRLTSVYLKSDKRNINIEVKKLYKFLSCLTVIIGYVILIPLIGFLLSSMIAVFCLTKLLGKSKWYNAMLLSVITSSVIYYSFTKFLNIALPSGILDFL